MMESDTMYVVNVNKTPQCYEKILSGYMSPIEEIEMGNQDNFNSRENDLVSEERSNKNKTPGTCTECSKQFSSPSNLRRHLRVTHRILGKPRATRIKCVECNTAYVNIRKLREHLSIKHGMLFPAETFQFANFTAFKKWKCEMERKTLCLYIRKMGGKKTPSGTNYYFDCHRSGGYMPKSAGSRKRRLKNQGSCKIGVICTSTIFVQEDETGISVTYYPRHYGHGHKINAEQEHQVSKGSVPGEIQSDNLTPSGIEDIAFTTDNIQLELIRRKDFRCIESAFDTSEYHMELDEISDLNHWVKNCELLENSAVLFYDNENFSLIIMTEYQKNVLLAANTKIMCIDTIQRKKGWCCYLTILYVVDEQGLGFPASYCISKKINKATILNFLECIKSSAGQLETEYLLSDNDICIFDAWKEVMNENTKWLWSTWYIYSKWLRQLQAFKGTVERKSELFQTMKRLVEYQDHTTFFHMYQSFIKELQNCPCTIHIANYMEENYSLHPEMWAFSYRKDIDTNSIFHFENLHKIFKYCCTSGRGKRIKKFVHVVMKIVRNKIFNCLANAGKRKQTLAICNIAWYHDKGMKIDRSNIVRYSNKEWAVKSITDDEPVYVKRDNVSCPEHCSLVCDECDTCVHLFTCTCNDNLINANLCDHIHAVAWTYFSRHFEYSTEHNYGVDEVIKPESDLFQDVLKRTHEVYKIVKSNKCNLNDSSLQLLMECLDKCVNICSRKETIDVNTSTGNNVQQFNVEMDTLTTPRFILPNNLPSQQYFVVVPSTNVPKL